MEKYLSIGELAEYIKLSKSTIYKKVMNSSIPVIKATGSLLFNREAIDKWLEGHSYDTKSEITNNISEFLKPQRKERQ